jgi:DNA-binding response OmpR family regulator
MKKRVLIVDDDNLARGYFRTLLTDAGYEVVEALDGREAVRLYREKAVDLIVMDIFMPRMSGLDAILEIDPKAKGTPIIALSGGGAGTGSDPLELARSLGAARTFHKPFKYAEFLAAVEELVGAPESPEEE